MVVTISDSLIREFHKKAKESFPNETFAFLLGSNENDGITIKEVFFPSNVEKYCRPDVILVQDSWYKEVKKYCKKTGSSIVADYHSHPYNKKEVFLHKRDAAPSEQDYESISGQAMAICLITECKNGHLRARTKFWGSMPQVKVKTTK
jgi:proteasome lid subunit RPN8/RPN11